MKDIENVLFSSCLTSCQFFIVKNRKKNHFEENKLSAVVESHCVCIRRDQHSLFYEFPS